MDATAGNGKCDMTSNLWRLCLLSIIISWKPRARVEINCGRALPEAEVIRISVRSSVRFP